MSINGTQEYKSVYIRKAHPGDIRPIADNIRDIDAFECERCASASPSECMEMGINKDIETYSIIERESDIPIAMFGVGACSPHEVCYLWMLAVKNFVKKCGREFIRTSRDYVKRFVNHYGPCMNLIARANTVSKRWLKFCGAVFIPVSDDLELFLIT
tara:strand:- start:613 stop:1083 length:471 start_codon:yes stop_codon:yes gene_type:complete